jgi:hypothetical protein
VNQVEASRLTSTRVDSELVNNAPEVMALAPLPFVTTKKEFPKMRKSMPNGWPASLAMGLENWSVNEPPAPMETSWLVENGGAKGVTLLPAPGAPSAALALVKFAAKPVP